MARTLAQDLVRKHQRGEKLVCLTAYDAPTATLVERAGVDLILVGDSVGNVVLGYPGRRRVTLDMMIHHTGAVVRGTSTAHVCLDMPFGTFQVSAEDAKRAALRALQETGCQSVKLEGGRAIAATARAIVEIGIPVLGHIGYTPQSASLRPSREPLSEERALELMSDAVALEEAGCFAVVLELVPSALAGEISFHLEIPTIGIGSGPLCDGQVLVLHDAIGVGPTFPHAKRYAEVGALIEQAAREYAEEVRQGVFPGGEHGFE
jgi:3-methyl-2-oxobutanoate hydroxymethyltransferase